MATAPGWSTMSRVVVFPLGSWISSVLKLKCLPLWRSLEVSVFSISGLVEGRLVMNVRHSLELGNKKSGRAMRRLITGGG